MSDQEKIQFDVEVGYGSSQENIDAIIKKMDSIKDTIAAIKQENREAQKEGTPISTVRLHELERELSKFQSVYNSIIQNVTKIDAIQVGNVKKQLEEFKKIISEFSGSASDFEKEVMGRFVMPNSLSDQVKAYKEIIKQLNSPALLNDPKDLYKKVVIYEEMMARYKNVLALSKNLDESLKYKAPPKDTSEEDERKAKEKADKEAERARKAQEKADALAEEKAKKEKERADKQAERERIAQEKADKRAEEKAKKEQERLDREAERKRVAQEKADKRAEEKAKKDQERLDREAAKQKAQEEKMSSATQRFIAEKAKLEELRAKIQMNYIDNKNSNPDLYAKNAIKLNSEYQKLNRTFKEAQNQLLGMTISAQIWNEAVDRLQKRAKWVLANLGVNNLFEGVASMFENVKKVEQEMATMSQVMATQGHSVEAYGKSLHDLTFEDVAKGAQMSSESVAKLHKDLGQMQESLMGFAVKYGEAHENVMKSATLWGRMYKDNNVVLTMTNAAMQLAVADSFDIVEANKNLESSVAQWGFEVKDVNSAMIVSNKICDSWTAIAHNMAVSAQDLSAANQRVAQSMNAVGISFDVGQALIASTLRNTQQTGAEIGNALKSIMGSIHSDKAVKDLEAMGIAVRQVGQDGQVEFRKVADVLVDLMIKTEGTKTNMEQLLKDISGGKVHLPQPRVIAA